MDLPGVASLEFLLVTVSLDEILMGEPETQTPGSIIVEYAVGTGANLDAPRASLPDHEVLFILANQGAIAARNGLAEQAEEFRYQYTQVNGPQATLRDIEGVVRAQLPQGIDGDWFPKSFEGRPYSDLVQSVRASASE